MISIVWVKHQDYVELKATDTLNPITIDFLPKFEAVEV